MSISDPHGQPTMAFSFLGEITEVFGDIHEDFAATITGIEAEVHQMYRGLASSLMSSGREPDVIIDDFATAMVWSLLIGREHAQRGYAAPLPRQDDFIDELIPDSKIAALLDGVQHELDDLDEF